MDGALRPQPAIHASFARAGRPDIAPPLTPRLRHGGTTTAPDRHFQAVAIEYLENVKALSESTAFA